MPKSNTVSGIEMDVNPLQLEKAYEPIVVTEFGIVNVPVRPLQPEKAELPIDVT